MMADAFLLLAVGWVRGKVKILHFKIIWNEVMAVNEVGCCLLSAKPSANF